MTVAPGSTTSFRATAEAEGVVSRVLGPGHLHPAEHASAAASAAAVRRRRRWRSGGGGSARRRPASRGSGGGKTHSGGIVYVTPETRITFGPGLQDAARAAVFRFTDSTGQPGTSFLCKVDRRSWRALRLADAG